MNYVELNIPLEDPALSEILIAELAELPFDSFEEETEGTDGMTGTLKAYIPVTKLADSKHLADEILAIHSIKGARYIEIETQNWNAVWESQFEPVNVEGKLIIRAPFHKPMAVGEVREIVIMPKMSFGTGHHATTRLMAAEMLEHDFYGRRVLDMGSGTGVLAILAAKLGATAVDAIDIDDWAYENARENIAVNGVEVIVKPVLGDVSAIGEWRYDVVLANINRNILLADMPVYVAALTTEGESNPAGALNPGGELIISGFFETDIPALEHRALELGLKLSSQRIQDGWSALSFRL